MAQLCKIRAGPGIFVGGQGGGDYPVGFEVRSDPPIYWSLGLGQITHLSQHT
jgi:hypothetical protein